MNLDSNMLFTHMLLEASLISISAANKHVLMYELLQPDSSVRESVAEMTLTLSQMQQRAYRSGYAKLPPEYQKRCASLRQIHYDRVALIDQCNLVPETEMSPLQAHFLCIFSQIAWLTHIKSGVAFNTDLAELCNCIIATKQQVLDDFIKSLNVGEVDQCTPIIEYVHEKFDNLHQAINKTQFDPTACYKEIFPTKLCTCSLL